MIFDYSLSDLIAEAKKIRVANFGNKVELRLAHNYLTRKKCTSDCAFCTWSKDAKLDYAEEKGLLIDGNSGINRDSCFISSQIAVSLGAGMELTSNIERLEDENLLFKICEIIGELSKKTNIGIQPGIIRRCDKRYFALLKKAGTSWFCNDIETAPSHFQKICTTHSLNEKIESLEMAKEEGLKIWSGFCIGIGETFEQRIEAIQSLRKINTDGVVLSFFYDVPGIPLNGKVAKLGSEEALKTIAILRILMPKTPIIIGGGRQYVFGDKQALIYEAGATGIYLGVFLNHLRPSVERDLAIIKSLNLQILRL